MPADLPQRPSLADRIRHFAFENYVVPARATTPNPEIRIRAGDVHKAMRLNGRMPAVCGALDAMIFRRAFGLELIRRTGPHQGANVEFRFRTAEASVPVHPNCTELPAQTSVSAENDSMKVVAPRGFHCPMTENACTDGRCKRGMCIREYEEVVDALNALDITLAGSPGRYRVNLRDRADAAALTAETLVEAENLGRAMFELRALRITLARPPGSGYYDVNFCNGADGAALAAETLDEAIKHGRAMAEARDELAALGITLARLPGGYRVNFLFGADESAQSADTLDEALKIGRAMVPPPPPVPKPPLWKQVLIELCIVGIFLLLMMAMFLRHAGAPSFPKVSHY